MAGPTGRPGAQPSQLAGGIEWEVRCIQIRLRYLIAAVAAFCVLAVSLPGQASASSVRACDGAVAPMLCRIHVHVRDVQHAQWVLGLSESRYGWAAERTHSRAYRAWINREWWRRSLPLLSATYIAPGLRSVIACISTHEEFGETGGNTSAGYYGMVYPVGVYPSATAHRVAAQVGGSWLSVALERQRQIVAELSRLGWGGWSTHGMCGV